MKNRLTVFMTALCLALTLTMLSAAAEETARTPAQASSKRPLLVMRAYFSGSSVSRLILTRLMPASRSAAAI